MQWVTFAANAASAKARPWAPWAALDRDDNYKGHISIFTVGICSHPFVHCQNSLWFDCGHGRQDHLHSSSSPSSYSVIVTTLRACAAWYCLAAAAASHNNNYHNPHHNPARAGGRACTLRALGLLLADGALTVGRGKTFWCINCFFLRKQL